MDSVEILLWVRLRHQLLYVPELLPSFSSSDMNFLALLDIVMTFTIMFTAHKMLAFLYHVWTHSVLIFWHSRLISALEIVDRISPPIAVVAMAGFKEQQFLNGVNCEEQQLSKEKERVKGFHHREVQKDCYEVAWA